MSYGCKSASVTVQNTSLSALFRGKYHYYKNRQIAESVLKLVLLVAVGRDVQLIVIQGLVENGTIDAGNTKIMMS